MPKSSSSKKKVTWSGLAVLIVVIGALWLARDASSGERGSNREPPASPQEHRTTRPHRSPTKSAPDTSASRANARLAELFTQKQSGVWVSLEGRVAKMLPDDNDGSRHQRFILSVGPRQTVLVAHNIDLALRVPVKPGSHISLEGKYEWNERGGVVHFTHLPSRGGKRGGHILLGEKRYR